MLSAPLPYLPRLLIIFKGGKEIEDTSNPKAVFLELHILRLNKLTSYHKQVLLAANTQRNSQGKEMKYTSLPELLFPQNVLLSTL